MDENAGLYVKVKQEYCTEPSIEQENDEYQGVAQISQSSYSASINLAHKALRMKEEQDVAMETPPDFGFSVVDVNRVQWLEPGQTPEVDPLQLSSPPIKDEPPLGLQETLFVDVKREPESQELPGDQELCPWNADESVFEPHVSIEESEDMETTTDVTYRVNPEGQDSAVTSEEGPSGLGRSSREGLYQWSGKESPLEPITSVNIKCEVEDMEKATDVMSRVNPDSTVTSKDGPSGLGRSSHEGDSTGRVTSLARGKRSKRDIPEKVSVKEAKRAREKRLACLMCEARFSFKSELTRHMITHAAVKPFACNICSGTFSQKFHLTLHMRTHTGVKPYTCDICKSSFSQKPTLNAHMRIHTGVKPFICNICDSSFSQRPTLKIHMRTHSGVKPYPCYICEVSFTQKSHLKTHMITHTRDKPHTCDFCNASFSDKSHLTFHLRTHTGGESSRL